MHVLFLLAFFPQEVTIYTEQDARNGFPGFFRRK